MKSHHGLPALTTYITQISQIKRSRSVLSFGSISNILLLLVVLLEKRGIAEGIKMLQLNIVSDSTYNIVLYGRFPP